MKQYRSSSNHRLRSGTLIVGAVRDLGLDQPPPMKAAADHLAAIEARQKAIASEADVRSATVAALIDNPGADLTKLAQAELVRDVEAQALSEAADRAREALSAVVLQVGDELVLSAREKVFEPAVKMLEAAAALPNDASLAQLVASKRHKEAEALTMAPIAAQQVRACLHLRDRLVRSETSRMACRVWRNPSSIDWTGHEATVGVERYIAGIRGGGQLWLGTFAEVDDADRQAKAAAKAKKQAEAAEAHRRINAAMTASRARRSERASVRA